MIRREIFLADGAPRWLLVSQVEHARLSHLLAEQCIAHFGATTADGSDLAQVRAELLGAILHHDDGWAKWEAAPGIDSQLHRPLSFRELPLGEALANWDGSIASAAAVGPLAAWTVAGHFAALLEHSKEEHDKSQSRAWLVEIAGRRQAWLAQWQSLNPEFHIASLAAEALLWLQTFDFVSLWLCSECPAGGETVSHWPEAYRIAPKSPLEKVLRASGDSEDAAVVQIDPWRFAAPVLTIEAVAHVVAEREYRSSAELLAAYVPHQLRWMLVPRGLSK